MVLMRCGADPDAVRLDGRPLDQEIWNGYL